MTTGRYLNPRFSLFAKSFTVRGAVSSSGAQKLIELRFTHSLKLR